MLEFWLGVCVFTCVLVCACLLHPNVDVYNLFFLAAVCGYRLTFAGYDYLALKALANREVLHSVGKHRLEWARSQVGIVSDWLVRS